MLVLSRGDVLSLLTLPDCIDAVEKAFRSHAERRTLGPGVLGIPTSGGGFHVKVAGLVGDRNVFAAKINANYPDNPRRFELAAIQGTVVLADACRWP
jgi:ornithine cyclodeaminase/alanine dehydrogenase-like protein (mu-crystallin family)